MQARRLGLQAREQVARSLHRQTLVVEAQAVEAAQLLAGRISDQLAGMISFCKRFA